MAPRPAFSLRPIAPADLAGAAATWIAAAIGEAQAARGVAHVALSGGSTPWAAFSMLAEHQSLDWTSLHLWQVDERIAPDGDERRNATGLRRALGDAPLPPDRLHLMDVGSPDPAQAAAAYATELARCCEGVLDLVHLGLGADGHTASWLPEDPVIDDDGEVSVTRTVYQGTRRMTLLPSAVNRARRRLFLIGGDDKTEALAALLAGDARLPASRVEAAATTILTSTPLGPADAGPAGSEQ